MQESADVGRVIVHAKAVLDEPGDLGQVHKSVGKPAATAPFISMEAQRARLGSRVRRGSSPRATTFPPVTSRRGCLDRG
jgi:hypothetical protein